jgi:hypothetical protein
MAAIMVFLGCLLLPAFLWDVPQQRLAPRAEAHLRDPRDPAMAAAFAGEHRDPNLRRHGSIIPYLSVRL